MTDLLERIAGAAAAVRDGYGTPLGSARMVAIRFGLTVATVEPLYTAEMWRRLSLDREAKRRAKLGLDKDDEPKTTALRPSKRMIELGLPFVRCPEADMPAGARAVRTAAWAASWEITFTRWVGMVPKRKKAGEPWTWHREVRVSAWLRRIDEWGIAEWNNGGWSQGWYWRDGEFRRPIGNRALLALIKDVGDSGSL